MITVPRVGVARICAPVYVDVVYIVKQLASRYSRPLTKYFLEQLSRVVRGHDWPRLLATGVRGKRVSSPYHLSHN